MLGLMQNQPLLISSLLEHAARHHAETEVVSRTIEGPIHRYTYADLEGRARKLANALTALGVKQGDRVATMAWNGFRHLELYYAISGMGAVLHTVNPRLFHDQLGWIMNHAEDSYLFFDLTFVPLVETLLPQLKTVKKFILMTDRAHMPAESKIPALLCYEELMAAAGENYTWPDLDENTASSLCYTSGTTGNPKGVLYSHRSNLLQAYGVCLPDTFGLSAHDCVLPVVPMFHANSWGTAYACLLAGTKLVLPGKDLDGKSVYELLETESVTFAGGVPTVWLALLQFIEKEGLRFSTLKRTVVGGAACPPAIMNTFRDKYGVTVLHAWGMTEMSPLGTVSTLKHKHSSWPAEKQNELLYKQGRVIYGVDMKIVDDAGKSLPWDGKAFGDLLVKGHWVLRDYYRAEPGSTLRDGWFPTGDVATIDPDGFMQITDRSKDVIKSGGEWISSIDLENLAVAHPAVAEAACIAAKHPKWDERPLLIVVKKPNAELTRDEMLKFFEGKIAKWWMPDDVVFVDDLPHTATGKLQKLKLREKFKDYKLPTA